MAHDPSDGSGVPFALSQNPAPNPPEGQDFQDEKTALTQQIMSTFRSVLPSNYVATTNGPWYSLQFQAMAEQLAEIQLTSSEVYKDSGFDFTRTDFLWQVLGSLVFPGATDRSGIPEIDGDKAYREFLHRMVLLLLQGATKASMEGGLEALDPDVVATITERYLESPPRDENGAFTIDDQFFVDIFIDGFPIDPFVLQRNAEIVLAALKPAHVLYGYSNLFEDAFEKIADDDGGFSFDLDSYYYDDLRKWCLGAKSITGTGATLADRTLFSDGSLSFETVREGATLKVLSGDNEGAYRVVGSLRLLSGADATPRAYTLSGGGSGSVVALDDETLYDPSRDWGALPPKTTISISAGPNAGTYFLERVLGPSGGLLGTPGVSGDEVRVAPSTLKVSRRMPVTASSQSYTVAVDRLGVQVPRTVSAEDVTIQFYL